MGLAVGIERSPCIRWGAVAVAQQRLRRSHSFARLIPCQYHMLQLVLLSRITVLWTRLHTALLAMGLAAPGVDIFPVV